MADPNLPAMYDTSSNTMDTNSTYYSLQQLQNQHHPQGLNHPGSYDSTSQRHEHFAQQPMQKLQQFDDVYQHDQYGGMQPQSKIGPYNSSGLQVQNLSQDQSFHSQGIHALSNVALSQQGYQVPQNYAVQNVQPQIQTQRQSSSWMPQNSQQQQGTVNFNTHTSGIDPQQHTLTHDSRGNSGHQSQSQRLSFPNSDSNQRMLISGNIMSQHQDPSQISQEALQYYQMQQSHNQHQPLYQQQPHFSQVYNQNKGSQMNYALKSDMQVDVGHDESVPNAHPSVPNYRNMLQSNISNDQNPVMHSSAMQDRQHQQSVQAIPGYSTHYVNNKDHNVNHYARNSSQPLQSQTYYNHPDAETSSQKIATTESYVTPEIQEMQKRIKEGYVNPSQLQQSKTKFYKHQQYPYQTQQKNQSNGQSLNSIAAHKSHQQNSQMRQYLELQQQRSYPRNEIMSNSQYLSDNTQSSSLSANYQPSIVLSHTGRVKGTR